MQTKNNNKKIINLRKFILENTLYSLELSLRSQKLRQEFN